MVGDIWPLTIDLSDSVFSDNGADHIATNWEVGWLRPGAFDHVSPTYVDDFWSGERFGNATELLDLVPRMTDGPVHEWTEEQLHHHEPYHLLGHTAVRMHRCQFSNNSHCHNGDCSNLQFNRASNVGYLYAGPTVLLNAAGHHLPVTLELSNITIANIVSSTITGIGSTMHSGNLTARYVGGDISGARPLCELAPYGLHRYGSGLVFVCDAGVPCNIEISNSRWSDNGYNGYWPERSCTYGIALGAVLRDVGSVARMVDSHFIRQSAPGTSGSGGAVYLEGPATFCFERCVFDGNAAGGNGAAIMAMSFLTGMNLLVAESVFIHNTVQPPDSTAVNVLASVYTGSTGNQDSGFRYGRSVWRIDDGPIFGNLSYDIEQYYPHYVDITFGDHVLHHGLIPDRILSCTSWNLGWIELVDVAPRIYVQFNDDRAEVYNCTNSYQTENPCPTHEDSHVLWSATPFSVGSAGAAIFTEGPVSLTIVDSFFENNTASVAAAAVESNWPAKLSIKNTTFDTSATPVAFKGGPEIEDCSGKTCKDGHGCSFAHSIISCTDCSNIGDGGNIGDGRACTVCAAGSTPNANHTACIPCAPGTAGRFGLCMPCVDGTMSTMYGSISCHSCPPASVANENAIACSCASGHYNWTQFGIITCTDNDYKEVAFENNFVYSVARSQIKTNQTCIECPACLDCGANDVIRLQEGFAEPDFPEDTQAIAPREERSLLRCRPEKARLSSTDTSPCLGGEFNFDGALPNCRDGHTGLLCFQCTSGYGKSSSATCVQCRHASGAVEVLKTAAMIATIAMIAMIAMIGLGFAVSNGDAEAIKAPNTKPEDNDGTSTTNPVFEDGAEKTVDDSPRPDLRRLFSLGLSISTQPFKIFISYFQIIGNIGAVLHIQFPPALAGLIEVFQPLIAPNFRILFECAGLTNDFHTTWALEVFVIPSILFLSLSALFVYRRSAIGVTAAKSMFFSESFFLLFLVFPFITSRLFSLLNCRDFSPTESRLAVDYTVDVSSPNPNTMF